MEQARWSAYLKDPSHLTDKGGDSVAELEGLRQRFPYCRVLYLLECRAMKEEDRLEWKQKAREWAILVPDRKKFLEFLQEKGTEKSEGEGEAGKDPLSERSEALPSAPQRRGSESGTEEPDIDPSPLEEQIRTEAVRDRILYDAEDALIESAEEEEGGETQEEAEDEGEGSEEENSSEEAEEEEREGSKGERSFMDWLDPDSGPENEAEEERSEEELIEAFISEGDELPKPEPKKEFFSSERMARNSSDESGLPVSETLAEIYVQQGDHKRAIQAFEQLRLNIPEKSDYFARRVQQIKERTKR